VAAMGYELIWIDQIVVKRARRRRQGKSYLQTARVVLRFGCTGGGRSVVGRVSEGERERRRGLGATRLAPATCSNERVDATDAGGLTRLRGGSTGIVDPAPSKEERELPLSIPTRFGGLTPRVELLRTCKTRSCSRCASIRFAS